MSILRRIPINPALADQSFEVALLDGVFRFRVYWQARLSSWFISVYDAANAPLIQGLRLAVNSDVLRPYRSRDNVPPSTMLVVDISDAASGSAHPGGEPGRLTLGTQFRLLYVDDRLPESTAHTTVL